MSTHPKSESECSMDDPSRSDLSSEFSEEEPKLAKTKKLKHPHHREDLSDEEGCVTIKKLSIKRKLIMYQQNDLRCFMEVIMSIDPILRYHAFRQMIRRVYAYMINRLVRQNETVEQQKQVYDLLGADYEKVRASSFAVIINGCADVLMREADKGYLNSRKCNVMMLGVRNPKDEQSIVHDQMNIVVFDLATGEFYGQDSYLIDGVLIDAKVLDGNAMSLMLS